MSEEKLIGRVEDGVAYITFNNPEKWNAVSLDMWIKFGELLDAYREDDGVRVLVINGAGGKACAEAVAAVALRGDPRPREAISQDGGHGIGA